MEEIKRDGVGLGIFQRSPAMIEHEKMHDERVIWIANVVTHKYTVRWIARHTVAGVEAESEEEAIKAMYMADDSFHCYEDFTAVIEEV